MAPLTVRFIPAPVASRYPLVMLRPPLSVEVSAALPETINAPPVIANVSLLPVVRLLMDSLLELIVTVTAEPVLIVTSSPAPGTVPVLQFCAVSQFELGPPPIQLTAESNCRCSRASTRSNRCEERSAKLRPMSFFVR